MTAHWGVPDPAEATGTPAEIALAFKDAYRMLDRRIGIFDGAAAALARSIEPAKEAARNRPARRRHRESGRADVKSSLAQRIVAEGLGTAFLLAAVVGSGIMAAKLSGGNGALALLCNTLPTGAILAVLILTFGPVRARISIRPSASRSRCAAKCRREPRPSTSPRKLSAPLSACGRRT